VNSQPSRRKLRLPRLTPGNSQPPVRNPAELVRASAPRPQRLKAAWHALSRRPAWLLGPFVIARVERLSVSTSGFDVQLAQDVADLGAPKAARILDQTDLAKFAESYRFVHQELEGNEYYRAKIHLQDLLVEGAAALASNEKFDPAEVRRLFANAAPTMRVLVLGLMQGDPSLADGSTVLSAISDPRSKNEQYQGLLLAQACWRRLSKAERTAIRYVIQDDPGIRAGSSRWQAAQEVLALPISSDDAVLGT
jgi:hypothetical protein